MSYLPDAFFCRWHWFRSIIYVLVHVILSTTSFFINVNILYTWLSGYQCRFIHNLFSWAHLMFIMLIDEVFFLSIVLIFRIKMLTLTFLLYFCSIFKGNTTDIYCNFFPSNVSQFLKEKKLKYTFYLTLMLRQLF